MESWLKVYTKEKEENLDVCCRIHCTNFAIKGRLLCEMHAFPGEQKKSDRRLAIEAQKKKEKQ